MPLFRDPETGLVVETDPTWATQNGYQPVSANEEAAGLESQGLAARGDERGVLGDVNATLTGAASGLTLGGTDLLLGAGLTDSEREQLLAEINKHPIERGVGELIGGIAPAFAGEGLLRTPTGYLADLAAKGTEDALAKGGLVGTAKALGVMGTEGALASGGAYLGHAALENKEVTAEGLGGALGTGFEFGSVGGGAFLGIANGTIAARKLFSRVMDKGAEKVAESAWTTASQAALEADQATADVARQRLDTIAQMKEEALRARQSAKQSVREEQIRAQANPEQPFKPEASPPMVTPDGTQVIPGVRGAARLDLGAEAGPAGETAVAQTSSATPEAIGPRTEVIPGRRTGAGESVAPDFTTQAPELKKPTELEALGRGEAEARRLKVSEPEPQQRSGILGMLDELGSYEDAKAGADVEGSAARAGVREEPRVKPQYEPTKRAPFSNLRTRLAQQLLPDMRMSATTELLGKDVAEEEAKLLEALHEFNNAKNSFVEHILANDNTIGMKHNVPRDFLAPSNPRTTATPEDILDLRHGQPSLPDKTGAARPERIRELLDQAHESALERVATAETPAERGAALQQADHLEHLLEKLAPPAMQKDMVPGDFLRSTDRDAKVIDSYEKAQKKLTEAVGDAAHPGSVEHAKAYDAANDEAVRKVQDRTARAIDDHETFGPFQYHGPEAKSPRDRIVYAKERQLDADKAYTHLANEERTAKKAADELNLKVKERERAKKAAERLDKQSAREALKTKNKIGLVTGIGGALEIANIPGLPKASDLPVVGPLLGAWLKYRAVKAALGRVGGRVPALADSRVAALAARTKDRIAMAVDRSIGLAGKVGRAGVKAAPLAAGVVTQRIYDDGHPVPPKDAPIQEHVAARVRELSAYVSTPNAIETDVRRQLIGVTDPDLIAAMEKQRRTAMEYLLANAPKMPMFGPLQKVNAVPSGAQAMSFARRMEAVDAPADVFERLAATQAQLSLEAADALRNVYPQLFQLAQQRVLQRAQEATDVPYTQRIRLSLTYKLPLDSSMDPDNLKIAQSVYDRPPPNPAPQMGPAGGPPTPSIAQPTNLLPMYQPSADHSRR